MEQKDLRKTLAAAKLVECGKVVGEQLFPLIVSAIAESLSARWVMLCEVEENGTPQARTLAFWDNGPSANFSYNLAHTPCENIVKQGSCAYPRGVAELFPRDELLQQMGAEGYVGTPLRAINGDVVGLLAVLHDDPIEDDVLVSDVLEIFAGRAAAEIERLQSTSVNERLGKVVEDSVSEVYLFNGETYCFELVNRGARENLGYTMEELRRLTPWDLKPEFSKEAFIAMVAPLRDGTERVLQFETRHQRKDGTRYDVSVRLQLLGELEKVFYAAIEDITARNNAARELGLTTQRLDAIINNTMMAIFMMDSRQHCVFMNSAAEQLTGFKLHEVSGRPLHDVIHHTHPDGRHFPLEDCPIDRAFPEENQVQGEETFIHKDGSFYPVAFTASPIRDDQGIAIGTVIEARDITEELRAREALHSFNEALQKRVAEAIEARSKIELQLLQAQKMEAIGKLTGGVAHDFNNLLQVVRGNLEFLARDVAGNEKAESRAKNALTAVIRGAKLASQLLAFGRRQPLEPKPINLARLMRELDDMLQRVLGDGVEVETVTAGGLWNCMADPTQVENAVLNLAINGRDAMDGHGKLTIEVGNASLDDRYVAQHVDVIAGQYVMIAVTDTGCGIPPDELEHVFEPFYTTKPEGQGTGLGLSMVYGFVKQSGGHVKIYSEVNQGTTVRMYLPRTRQDEALVASSAGEAVEGSETILLVEDDPGVRETAAELLSDLGYRVLKSKNADSALAVIESGAEIDLLFTDVVMPGVLRSTELAALFIQRFPNAAVLYTSGYTQNAIVHAGRLDPGVELLSKPYSREDLSRKIRQVLDPRKGQTAPKVGNDRISRQRKVLLLEDEPLIRMNTADMLAELNLIVIEAGSVREAMKLLQDTEVDVLVADLTLPDGSGFDVARAAKQANVDVFVVFATGKSVDVPSDLSGASWLSKPYDLTNLAKALSGASAD